MLAIRLPIAQLLRQESALMVPPRILTRTRLPDNQAAAPVLFLPLLSLVAEFLLESAGRSNEYEQLSERQRVVE